MPRSSRRRKRRRKPASDRKKLLLLGLVLAVAAGIGGYLLNDAPQATATGPAAGGGRAAASGGPSADGSAKPSTATLPTTYPSSGKGSYSYAAGGTRRFGTGTLKRYRVAVEDGIGVSPALFAAEVDAVLDDTEQGWSAGGKWSFQRVPSGPVAFTVYLTSPDTTYHVCLNLTRLDIRESAPGGVNCSNNGDTVVENVARWIDLTRYYKGRPDLYHALAINHEVGHSLQHGHVSCTGAGDPAPVMMQQIKGLHGCVPNGWPYSKDGKYLTGPAAP